MEKFKYIIIFLLTVLLGLTYYQLNQYQKISNKLIAENNYLDKKNEELSSQNLKKQETIEVLNRQIKDQEQEILSLQNHLSNLLSSQPLQKDYNEMGENPFEEKAPGLKNNDDEQKPDLSLDPGVNLDENNEIESIEIKLKKSFDGL